MKKNNEGYALPFVLVVSVVMCLIAVAVMSFSLKNLQTQQASIQQMQAKYDAAGKIEEIVAATQTDGTEVFQCEGIKFSIPSGKILRIEANGISANKETTVLLVAEIELVDASSGNGTTATDYVENNDGTLTVKYNGEISFKSYSYELVSGGEG